jgi:hypothetical protein
MPSRLATIPRTFFHYTPSAAKNFDEPARHRHRDRTYVEKKPEKIAAQRIFSKRWGSWAKDATPDKVYKQRFRDSAMLSILQAGAPGFAAVDIRKLPYE